MHLKSGKILFISYIIIALLELLAEFLDHSVLRFASKPLLMIILAAYFYTCSAKPISNANKILLVALFFAWGGDVALLFTSQFALAFLIGLASFLTGHILYIIHFNQKVNKEVNYRGFVFENKFMLIPFIAYAYFLIYFVYQGLGDMKVPVFIYCAVILCMCVVAINRYGRTTSKSALLIITGALLFMFSDSIIALNKFTPLFESNHILASLLIMTLYIAGQYLIVEGSIAHEQTS